jgi:hypothetical protein
VSLIKISDASYIALITLCVLRDKLRGNLLLKQHQLEVDLRHVGLYNDELAHAIQDKPAEILPLVRPEIGLRNDV